MKFYSSRNFINLEKTYVAQNFGYFSWDLIKAHVIYTINTILQSEH